MPYQPAIHRHNRARILAALCGWLLYICVWFRVLSRTPGADAIAFAVVMTGCLLAMHGLASAWVKHNKRIAKAGRRGLITRYTNPVFAQDHLGRQLSMDRAAFLEREIFVCIHDNIKFYASTPQRRPDRADKFRERISGIVSVVKLMQRHRLLGRNYEGAAPEPKAPRSVDPETTVAWAVPARLLAGNALSSRNAIRSNEKWMRPSFPAPIRSPQPLRARSISGEFPRRQLRRLGKLSPTVGPAIRLL